MNWKIAFAEWFGLPEDNVIWLNLELAQIGAEQVIDRSVAGRRLQIVCGAAGSGKDHLFLRGLKQRHLPVLVIDTTSEAALVRWCWQNRNARVALLSDNNKMLNQATLIDMLKHICETGRVKYAPADVRNNQLRRTAAEIAEEFIGSTDPGHRRRLQRERPREDSIPDPEFHCQFGILWSSNINYTDPNAIPAVLKPHWPAILSRGANPRFIPEDVVDLFRYSLHLVLQRGMLRGLHFKLDDVNAVLRTFIEHRGYLRDVSPRGMKMLAQQRTDLRTAGRLNLWPKIVTSLLAQQPEHPALLKLDTPMFQIIPISKPVQGWQHTPAPKPDPKPDPEPDHQPDPEPPAPNHHTDSNPPEQPDEPRAGLPVNPVSAQPVEELISKIYGRAQIESCQSIASALAGINFENFAAEDFERLSEQLHGLCDMSAGNWRNFYAYEHELILFHTDEEVLIYDKGLEILSWDQAMERIRPRVEVAQRERNQQIARDLLQTKLPPKRKLKKVQTLLKEIAALGVSPATVPIQEAIDWIMEQWNDYDRFADCLTLRDYLDQVVKHEIEPKPKLH